MIRLAWTLVRAAGWPRALLLAVCTAIVCALLLVVIAYAELPVDPDEWLMSVVADSGTRGGAAGGALMLTLPPLLLLHQVVRFGTSARERRLAALRLAGATPAEVRLLGAIEVGIPSAIGALGGILLFWLLRAVAGGTRYGSYVSYGGIIQRRLLGGAHLVPTTVGPPVWAYAAVVVGVALLGVAVGLFATRAVVATPLGLVRRARRRAPRPWGLVLIVLAIVFATGYTSDGWYDQMSDDESQIFGVALVAAALIGLMSLAPWLAWLTGRVAAARASSVPLLLGARRLVHDPRSAGRAAAAAGGIGLVAGGWAMFVADVGSNGDSDEYVGPLVLVVLALLAALIVVVGSLAVHSVEQVLDRRPSIAALAALGTPRSVVAASQRWELGLVAIPIATVGALAGALFLASVEWEPGMATAVVAAPIVTGLLVWFAVVIAVWIVSPATRHVADVAHLRAE